MKKHLNYLCKAAVLLMILCSIGSVSADSPVNPEIIVNVSDELVPVGQTIMIPVEFYNMSGIIGIDVTVPNNNAGITVTVNETLNPLKGFYEINSDPENLNQYVSWFTTKNVTSDKSAIFWLDVLIGENVPDSVSVTVQPTSITNNDGAEIATTIRVTPGELHIAKPPVIGNPTVDSLTNSSATITFDVSANPEVTKVQAILGDGTKFNATGSEGTYTAELTGLTPETEYTVSGWAINDAGETTGESVTFTTSYKPEVTTILLSDEPESMIRIGDSGTLTAEVLDQKDTLMSEVVSWVSSNKSVISIDAEGTFKALAKGTATLKAELAGKLNETPEITVIGTPSVAITEPASSTFFTDEAISFTAKTADFAEGVSVSWDFGDKTSSESGESVTHIYTGADSYTVTVTATGTDLLGKDETKTDTVTLTINRPAAYPKWLVIGETPEVQPIPFGTEGTLTAIVYNQYDEVMPGEPVVWSSDKESVLTIDGATGTYKGVGAGVANVTAKAGTATNVTTITVLPEVLVPTSVKITVPGSTLKFDDDGTATAQVLDQHGKVLPDEKVTWSSDNESVISINTDGNYIAQRVAGTANLTATSVTNTSISASLTVTNVRPASIAKILTITGTPTAPIAFNATGLLTAVVTDQFDEPMTTQVVWSSDKASVLTIDATGTYKGVGAGVANVTAKAGNATNVTTITVLPEVLVPTSVKITVPGSTLKFDDDGTATAQVLDQHGNVLPDEKVTWSSDNESVISIDSVNGTYTAHRVAGTANLTATSVTNTSISASLTVTNVRPASVASSISIIDLPETIESGYNATLNATVYDQFEEVLADQKVVWSSDNTAVLNIIKTTGFFRAINAGTANVTVSLENDAHITTTRTVTVTKQESAASVVAVIPSAMTMSAGDVYQFSSANTIVYDQYGSRILSPKLEWSSSNSSVAGVTETGLLSAIGSGTTTVTAASGTASGTTTVTVNAPAAGKIYVFGPAETGVEHGGVFTALVLSTTGAVMENAGVSWTSDNPAIRILDPKTGRYYVHTVSVDTEVTITASSGGVTGTKTILVKAPENTARMIDSLTLIPQSASLTAGQSATFVALPVNTTFGVIMDASYDWSSSDSSVADVTGTGMLGAVTTTSAGTADITVTARSGAVDDPAYKKSGTIAVTVS